MEQGLGVLRRKASGDVSDGVEVYYQESGSWTTLSAAKSFGAELTVYYSGALGGDAVVRVVTVG